MTVDEKKKYLRQYRYLEGRVNSLCDELAKWRSLAERVTPVLSDMPKGSGGDRLPRTVEKIIELEQELDAQIDQMIDTRREIEKAVAAVDDQRLRDVLRYRYIEGMTQEETAERLELSSRQIRTLEKVAEKRIPLPVISGSTCVIL